MGGGSHHDIGQRQASEGRGKSELGERLQNQQSSRAATTATKTHLRGSTGAGDVVVACIRAAATIEDAADWRAAATSDEWWDPLDEDVYAADPPPPRWPPQPPPPPPPPVCILKGMLLCGVEEEVGVLTGWYRIGILVYVHQSYS